MHPVIQGGEDAYDSDALSCRSEVSFSKGATANTHRTLRLLWKMTFNNISVLIVFAYVYNYTPWDPFKTPEDIPRLPSIYKVKQSVHLNPFDGNDIGAHLHVCVVPI